MAKQEMEEKYTLKQLSRLVIIKANKIYTKTRSIFHRNTGNKYPSHPFILPQHSKLKKSILRHIHDSQGPFKIENNSSNMHSQTKPIQSEPMLKITKHCV